MKKLFALIVLFVSIGLWADAPKITTSLSFTELQKLKASAPSQYAQFGISVAVDGDTAVIGEPGYYTNISRAYIYKYNTTTQVYTQVAILQPSDVNDNDFFGYSVAVSGDTVAVGAMGDNETKDGSGAVYIYTKPQSGWADTAQENAKLKASDADAGDSFGNSVAISGDTVIVGAMGDDETNSQSGATYIYEKPQSGWADTAQENAKLKASDADAGDSFGNSVAISGDTVVVGAYGDDETKSSSGAAYIYEKPQSGWADTTQENAKLKASDADEEDEFGKSVAISGDTVVIGADKDDDTNNDSGAAYIYTKPQSGWANTTHENAKLKASDADAYDYFGWSVAISGKTIVVGAENDDETNDDSGAAYIYEKPQSGWTDTAQENAKLKASDADGGDSFGYSVAMSGDTVVVGAIGDDKTEFNSGAAYIYKAEETKETVVNSAIVMYLLN